MSEIIPPLLSNTPPPPPLTEEDEEDEFGDFTGANDISYGCDNLSLPPSPDCIPDTVSIINGLDINSNTNKNKLSQIDVGIEKDFQDKRKVEEGYSEHTGPVQNSCIEDVHKKELFFEHSTNNDFHIGLSPTGNNLEVYKAPLDSNECIKSEKQENIEDTVNNYENNEDNHKLSNDQNQEVLTKNLENERDDFVNSDFKTKQIVDEPIEKLDIGKQIVNKISGLEIDLIGVPEDEVVKEFNNEIIINNSESRDCASVTPVLEKSENSEDIEENVELSVNNPSQNAVSNTDKITAMDVQSSQETEEPKMVMINENEIETHGHHDIERNIPLDSLDDFTFVSNYKSLSTEVKNDSETNETVDEFGDFSNAVFNETEKKEAELKNDFNVNNDDDFGDFSSHAIFPKSSVDKKLTERNEFDDDFGEFACTVVPSEQPEWSETHASTQEDDFGNFADFSEVTEKPVILTLNEKQAFDKAKIILKDMFPSPDNAQDDFLYVNVEKDDVVFNELKDVTESPALLYHWSKSSSQNLLLKALNIDARNILYGPPWNPSMPRFAANLGMKPLEPMKTETLTPTPSKSSPSLSIQSANVDIPSAQFDWTGSGLVNPLDYSQTMLLDLELVASLEIPTSSASSNNSISPSIELDEWDIWLQSVSKENPEPSSPSGTTPRPLELSIEPSLILQPKMASPQDEFKKEPSKTDLEQKVNDDFEDFTSFQSSQVPQTVNWPNVPLRETYISNDSVSANISKEIPLEVEGWLQPTIVTPELPRKDLSLGDEELPDVQTPELSRKNVALESLDTDFDDFQMIPSPEQSAETNTVAFSGVSELPKPDRNMPDVNIDALNLGQVDFASLNFVRDKKIQAPAKEEPNKRSLELQVVEDKRKPTEEDDEFTDFHSFTPIAQQATPKTLTPILEPLKPIPVYPTVQYPATSTSQINWPDPGVTDEEVKMFEMVFSQAPTSKPEPSKKEAPQPIKEAQRESVADDDDWSDFVSVQKPSPIHKFQSNEREHTSSPDLPLSVLNLGNIQPTKQPIPVITPHGLVQTKLSSNNPVNMSPKSHVKLAPQQKLSSHPRSQPSIISNQFATQAYNFNSYASQSKAALNVPAPSTGNVNQKSLDEDDWSDFVSSPLPPSTANGYQQSWQHNPPYSHAGWTNASPNIIMNPGHFVQSTSDVRSKKVPSYPVTNKKNTVTNISMPDLEFIAPKGRTSSSRRK